MNTFTWEADKEFAFVAAFEIALNQFRLKTSTIERVAKLEAFTAFKVNGLWVVTITYK